MNRRATGARLLYLAVVVGSLSSCAPTMELKRPEIQVPDRFNEKQSAKSVATVNWREFFPDPRLVGLIEIALKGNQERSIFLQELEVARNEAYARSGAYLPAVELGGDVGLDKPGRYTRFGAVEESLEVRPGKRFPEPLTNYSFGARASWELDIWGRLRSAQKAAVNRFLATKEGQAFLVTNLIAEVANLYFELCALDEQLSIVQQNVSIQNDALKTVQLEKTGARVTELAVRRFEAQLLKTEGLSYEIRQKLVEVENRLNFVLGRFPQPIERSCQATGTILPKTVDAGIPSELLQNRADIRQAELEMAAAELDVNVARAAFYPSLTLTADVGYEAYRVGQILKTPESLLYSLAGSITGPFINRREITAGFYSANAKQRQAVFAYERTVLNAFVEVSNAVANLKNITSNAELRAKQVSALVSSVDIANMLFSSARADYTEVLLTQREALESRFELIETKLRQRQAIVHLYRALGGGWDRESQG